MTTPMATGQAHWVGAWYAAPSQMISANLSGRTMRQIVHLHAGGTQLRLRPSNRYGGEPVTLTALSVGQPLQGPVLAPGAQTVRFAGNSAVTLEPGQEVVSDPVALQVEAFSDLAVTFFLDRGESLTGHLFAGQTSYVSDTHDVSAAPPESLFFVYPLLTGSWWLLTGVDVLPSAPLNAVVTFGSSTTDGVGSTPNANQRWPDYLAHRLKDAGTPRFMSVINAGLRGNQLTSSELPLGGGAHGGFMTIDMMGPVVPELARTRQVIAVELQGHGHTADRDRPFSFEQMADDIAAVIRLLGLERADVFGFSWGGNVAFQTAIRYPEVVRKLVVAGAPCKSDGEYPEIWALMATFIGESSALSRMREAYVITAPQPQDWSHLIVKAKTLLTQDYNWSQERPVRWASPLRLSLLYFQAPIIFLC